MAFDNLKDFADMLNFKAFSISTKWNDVKTSDHFYEYPNYDYFPILKGGILVGMVFGNQVGSKEEIELCDSTFLQEDADILDVIDGFKINYKNAREKDKAGFLILGGKEEPLGMLTFADLNSEEVSALVWRIIKSVEIALEKNIGEITYDMIVNSLDLGKAERIRKWVEENQDNRLDLGFVNYLSLSDIKKVVKKWKGCFPEMWRITNGHLTGKIIKLRNKVSYHRVGKSLLTNREGIYELHESLKDLDFLYANISGKTNRK